jgi:hypothetical protein
MIVPLFSIWTENKSKAYLHEGFVPQPKFFAKKTSPYKTDTCQYSPMKVAEEGLGRSDRVSLLG